MTPSNFSVDVAATGLDWVGGGIRSISSLLDELIRNARHSLDITAYSVTDGAAVVFDALEKRLRDGVTVRLVVDNLADRRKAAARALLAPMLDRFPGNFLLWDYPKRDVSEMAGLHAKLLIADRSRALVGSANLSFLGLAASHELAVCVNGQAANTVALCFDRLVVSSHVSKCTTSKDLPE